MPPHCDSMDGPVVTAARAALDAGEVERVLAFVPAASEPEIREAFTRALAARRLGGAAAEVADRYFFETAVRVHRAGEGAPFTGLKPAGLDHGPAVPAAERAIVQGRPDELVALLGAEVREEAQRRFEHVMELEVHADEGVPAAREYVEAMLGLEVWSHTVHESIHAAAHEGAHVHA